MGSCFTLFLPQTTSDYEGGHTCVNEVCSSGGVSCELLTQMAVGKPSADRLFLLTHEYLFLGCTEGMAEGEKSLGREDPGMLIHFKTVLKTFSPLASHLF